MARSYKRDGGGRFAGGGGGKGGGGDKAKGGGAATPKAAAKPAAPKAAPKTSTARGRAKATATQARQAMKGGGNQNKSARSLSTAQRAADYYKATGTGTKRSANKGSGGSKPAKAVMSKGTVAQRKAAVVKRVSNNALAGKPNTKAAKSYVSAQQAEKQRTSGGGKGSKAARRIANAKKKVTAKPQAAPSKKRSLPKTSRPGTIKGKVTRNPSAGKKLAAMKAKRTPAIVRAVASAGVGAYVAGQAARARVNKAVAGMRKGAAGRGRKR